MTDNEIETTNGHEWTRMFMTSPLNTQKKQMPRRRRPITAKGSAYGLWPMAYGLMC